MTAQLTVLNDMASDDFDAAIRTHQLWGLEWMDLRTSIWGKRVDELTSEDAARVREAVDAAGLGVYCMSTGVFFGNIADGEAAFREQHLARLPRIIQAAQVLRPKNVRLIAALLPGRHAGQGGVAAVRREHPWLVDVYREAIDLLADAGLHATIENEAFGCFLSETTDFLDFFDWLDRPGASLTWDINNQWATGVFPTVADYERLTPLIGYFHLKGGQTQDGQPGRPGDRLVWNAALADSSFDVVGITRQVVDDGASPVICLNPSQHGKPKPDYDYTDLTKRDVDFLRAQIEGIE